MITPTTIITLAAFIDDFKLNEFIKHADAYVYQDRTKRMTVAQAKDHIVVSLQDKLTENSYKMTSVDAVLLSKLISMTTLRTTDWLKSTYFQA